MVAELALVLGLLVSSRCEVRGRDPDVEDNAEEEVRKMGGSHLWSTVEPLPAAKESFWSRNLCRVINRQVQTAASQCRTELCTIRSPCPGRQQIMNTVSHCPLHKQKQLIFLWCCCNGNSREHYELADAHLESTLTGASYSPGRTVSSGSHQSVALSREQNDQHTDHIPLNIRTAAHHAVEPNYAKVGYQTNTGSGSTVLGQVSQNYPPRSLQDTTEIGQVPFNNPQEEQEATPPPYTESPFGRHQQGSINLYNNFPAPLPVPHMMALVMSQLQPLIQNLNISLQQLSQQVGVLAQDVAQLKSRPELKQQEQHSGWDGREELVVEILDKVEELDGREVLDKGEVLMKEEVLDKGEVLMKEEVLDKGEVLMKEEVLDKGEVLMKEEVLDKGEVLIKVDVLDKGEVLMKEEVLDFGEVLIKVEALDNGEVLTNKEVLDNGEVLVNKEVLEKGEVLTNKEVLEKGEVLTNKGVLDNGEVLTNKEVPDKGEVLTNKEVLDNGEVLTNKEVLEKGEVLTNKEVPDKGEVLTNKEVLDKGGLQHLEVKLDQALLLVAEVQKQMEQQRLDMELHLQSQHALLLNNLSSFQTDMDLKLQQHQESLQERMDAVNATLAQVQKDPIQGEQKTKDDKLFSASSAIQKAVDRLDNMVVGNTGKVRGLKESMDSLEGRFQFQLRQVTIALNERINQTARTSQIQYMETGLEVEAAREVVLRRVAELAGNLSMQDQRLQEVEGDLDYVFSALYQHNSSHCECSAAVAAVSRLETGLANLTEQVNENRLALDEEKDRSTWPGDRANDWEPAVEALQRSVQQVKMSVVSEQSRTRTVELSLTRLSDSLTKLLLDVSEQKQVQQRQMEELTRLSGSFKSLLQDGIRHNDVLELLLGEEVLEFLEWSVLDQEAHSIPAMKDRLYLLQEQLTKHSQSISLLLGGATGGSEETSADQPTSIELSKERRRSTEARTAAAVVLPDPDRRSPATGRDGGDIWRLEQQVEVLKEKLYLLEEGKNSCCEKATELQWLKRDLQDHLTVFEKTFRNADVLADSDTPLDLLKIWKLARDQEERRKTSATEE